MASIDCKETWLIAKPFCSLVNKPTTNENNPADNICTAAFMVVEPATFLYLEYKEPAAQPILPIIKIRKPASFIGSADKSALPFPANNINTPAKPIRKPTIIILLVK